MKRFLLCAVILVALTGAAGAQAPIPIDASSVIDSVGAIHRSIGPGGPPVLHYQKGDNSWDFIVDDWVQVGGRQVWKSVRGNHRVFADSTGAAIYARGNHYLGTQTTHLVKFKKADSTWVTLRASLPDSVRTSGRKIVFHGIFPGVDKKLVNNAKVFRSYAETFVFHQEARDSLAAWGPWTGYLLGTATRLSTDSLNLTLRDVEGVFSVGPTGRMVDGWVALGSADTAAFYLGTTYLQTPDSATTIPVRKWLVRFAGNPWLVELFDPIAAGGLPAGDVWHDATFGNDGTPGGGSLSLSGNIRGDTATMGGTAGTMDSITCYMTDRGGTGGNKKKYAVYETDGTLVGQTVEEDPGIDLEGWRGIEASGTVNLSASTQYILCAWANYTTNAKTGSGGAGDFTKRQVLAYNGFPAPASFGNATFNKGMSIYATYTEVGGVSPRRRRVLLEANR